MFYSKARWHVRTWAVFSNIVDFLTIVACNHLSTSGSCVCCLFHSWYCFLFALFLFHLWILSSRWHTSSGSLHYVLLLFRSCRIYGFFLSLTPQMKPIQPRMARTRHFKCLFTSFPNTGFWILIATYEFQVRAHDVITPITRKQKAEQGFMAVYA